MVEEIKRIDNPAQFIMDTGLLFEINRRVLHPFGLALEMRGISNQEEFDDQLQRIAKMILVLEDQQGKPDGKFEITDKVAIILIEHLEELTKLKTKIPSFGGIWDYRDDPEGILYQEETFEMAQEKYQKFLDEFGRDKLKQRKDAIGYIHQSENKTEQPLCPACHGMMRFAQDQKEPGTRPRKFLDCSVCSHEITIL